MLLLLIIPERFVIMVLQCSVSCGGGYRIREVNCVIPGLNNMVVEDAQCDHLPVPVRFEYCSLESCELCKEY